LARASGSPRRAGRTRYYEIAHREDVTFFASGRKVW
jgi:hypothetical protein